MKVRQHHKRGLMLLRSEVGFSALRAVTVDETNHVGQGICLSYDRQTNVSS